MNIRWKIMSLHKMFDMISVFFTKYRKRYPDMDYREAWGTIVCALGANSMLEFNNWCDEIKPGGVCYSTFTDKVLDLPEKIVNGRGEEKLMEQHHFMIQIFRIPLQKNPTVGNLLQVACYVGLLRSHLRIKDFSGNLAQLFKNYGVSMINYINEEDTATIERKLTGDILKMVCVTCKDLMKSAKKKHMSTLTSTLDESLSDDESSSEEHS